LSSCPLVFGCPCCLWDALSLPWPLVVLGSRQEKGEEKVERGLTRGCGSGEEKEVGEVGLTGREVCGKEVKDSAQTTNKNHNKQQQQEKQHHNTNDPRYFLFPVPSSFFFFFRFGSSFSLLSSLLHHHLSCPVPFVVAPLLPLHLRKHETKATQCLHTFVLFVCLLVFSEGGG
jgi:hypothetical protein